MHEETNDQSEFALVGFLLGKPVLTAVLGRPVVMTVWGMEVRRNVIVQVTWEGKVIVNL